jgi:hypothetical protein
MKIQYSREIALEVSKGAEYTWVENPDDDAFADLYD